MNLLKFKFYRNCYMLISGVYNKVYKLLHILYEKAMTASDAYEKELGLSFAEDEEEN